MSKFFNEKSHWINEPNEYVMTEHDLVIKTEPHTDFWQRTYYGFQNDNAPALLMPIDQEFFTLTVKTEFDSKQRFDQCGVIIYQNADNWFKASIEYENESFQRLGSVVTNDGYSDWATVDIPATQKMMYYRLSRRGSDYLIENSLDGLVYKQMRIFHLKEGSETINVGIYACSPENSSFNATFSQVVMSECVWESHQ
ncbi:MAG: DUF1349 domain-containing protein [Culicoidibacterales bacterium]